MLVHICCSVDSHYFLQELRKLLPKERLIGYFYDPNIHPLSEYELRYFDVKRSCDKLGIELIKGEYDYNEWINYVKGYENEPERGKRCQKCFDFRLESSANLAVKLGEKTFTTTLLTSPKKDLEQLNLSMQEALKGKNLDFFCVDFRKNGGINKQLELAKKDKLYHQNYCGCIYGLNKQKSENELIKELSTSIYKDLILPSSAEQRLQIFSSLKDENDIIRKKILNYRLLYAKTFCKNEFFKSFILFYSHFTTSKISLSLDINKDVNYCNKDGLCVLTFAYANRFFSLKSFDELCKNAISINKQNELRKHLFGDYSLNPIIILEQIPKKLEIIAKSIIFDDFEFCLL